MRHQQLRLFSEETMPSSTSSSWTRRTRTLERSDNPPAFVTDERAWNRAKRAVAPRWSEYADPWAVVVHVYQAMTKKTAAKKKPAKKKASAKKRPAAKRAPKAARKKKPRNAWRPAALARGIRVEAREHGKALARRVATDHLRADPHYYDRKLAKERAKGPKKKPAKKAKKPAAKKGGRR